MPTQSLFELNDRTVIITGAIGGLGQEVTTGVLESGADVVCVDRAAEVSGADWENLQNVAKASNTRLSYYTCDVRDPEDTRRAFEAAMASARHPLRGLVTCAGVTAVGKSIDFSMEHAQDIININTIGTFVCAQAAARIVLKQKVGANFVFIASMSGYIVNKGVPNAAYAASKAAVHQLTRNLASEWGGLGNPTCIRVNSVSPGYIKTAMLFGWLEDPVLENLWTSNSMLGRLSVPRDYRGPVVFLLSDASGFITGTDLLVDGGHTRW